MLKPKKRGGGKVRGKTCEESTVRKEGGKVKRHLGKEREGRKRNVLGKEREGG